MICEFCRQSGDPTLGLYDYMFCSFCGAPAPKATKACGCVKEVYAPDIDAKYWQENMGDILELLNQGKSAAEVNEILAGR